MKLNLKSRHRLSLGLRLTSRQDLAGGSAAPTYGSGILATHWRLVVLAHSGSAPSMAELELREFSGGPNISPTATSITASSEFDGTTLATNVADGDPDTIWGAAVVSGPHTLTFVFPGVVGVAEVVMTARNDAIPEQTPSKFRMEYSTDAGTIWNFGFEVAADTWSLGATQSFIDQSTGAGVAQGEHLWWGLYITEAESTEYVGLSEMVLKDGGGVARSTAGGFGDIIGSSFINSSNSPPKAFDDNTASTGWISELNAPKPQWIKGTFGATGGYGLPVEVKTIDIYGSWNLPTSSPEQFTLVWSDDGESWYIANHFASRTTWTASELRTFSAYT